MSEGIAAIQARIANIEQLVGIRRAAQTTAGAQTTSTSNSNGTTDFAALLEQAQAAQAGNASLDLSKYQNGRIPANALMSLGVGDHKLAAPAATNLIRLRNAAANAGVTIGINDSYRSYDEQVKMAKEKGLYGKGGLAAVPGTSEHGLGVAVDLQLDAKGQAWMKQNAKPYGFVNNVSGEPWHWTYKP
jgi:LAS superfamily LD-carboxypeptidase LdcB